MSNFVSSNHSKEALRSIFHQFASRGLVFRQTEEIVWNMINLDLTRVTLPGTQLVEQSLCLCGRLGLLLLIIQSWRFDWQWWMNRWTYASTRYNLFYVEQPSSYGGIWTLASEETGYNAEVRLCRTALMLRPCPSHNVYLFACKWKWTT